MIENEDGMLVAENPHQNPGTGQFGYRRFVWTRKLSQAMRWAELGPAVEFQKQWLPGNWRVRIMKAEDAPPHFAC